MKGPVIVGTGPLVALVNRREQEHAWVREQWGGISPPALTCEAVISEGCFLLQDVHGGITALMRLLERDVVRVAFDLTDELPAVVKLLKRYSSVPMSLADACLVRMSEQFSQSPVLTLDSDFGNYRKNGRGVIPALIPR